MADLRIALTVLPVGPRGQEAIERSSTIWFALQIAAGFTADVEPLKETVAKLWPWRLHVLNGREVTVNAWLGNTMTGIKAEVEDDAFAKTLRAAIENTYASEEARKGLDLRLLLPGAANETYERANFPARVQYLATLPGELSWRLMTTLYVPLDRGLLFTKNGNDWEPNHERLFLVPHEIQHDAKVALDDQPKDVGDGRFEVKKDNVLTIGPGFELQRLAQPVSSVFDLITYEVPVAGGDRRFIEMETIILDAHDPFAQLDGLQQRGGHTDLALVDTSSGKSRVVPQETFAALTQVWRVRALANELRATFPSIIEALRKLLAPDDTTALQIPERWAAGLTNAIDETKVPLLDVANVLASRLGIPAADSPATLRRVSDASGFAAIAALAAQAFDETLSVTANADALKDAWSFGKVSDRNELAERRIALAQTAARAMREARLVDRALSSLESVVLKNDNAETKMRESLRSAVEKEWTARRESTATIALVALELASKTETKLEGANQFDTTHADAHVESVWPARTTAQTELPGRGMPLVAGRDQHRAVHEVVKEEDGQDLYREIGGVLLFARRSSIDETDLANRDWRIVTGGTAFVGDLQNRIFAPGQTPEITDDEWLQRLLAIPIRPVFQQKVARADLEYHGQPMLSQSPLDQAYQADQYEEDSAGGLPEAFSYQSLGSFDAKVEAAAIASRAPALRYGDFYEFSGRLIDQAGGLAADIQDDKPWRLKMPAKGAVASSHRYARRVPAGDVNVLPGTRTDVREDWPALASDVALRSREWWGLTHANIESLPALLFSASRLPSTLSAYSFRVFPPAIDEHTLLRWAVPMVDDADRTKKLERLTAALSRLFDDRLAERAHALHDPAVTHIGIRIRAAGAANRVAPVFSQAIKLDEETEFQYKPLIVNVTTAAFAEAANASATLSGLAIDIVVPEGTFAVLEVFPLVAKVDFERFDGMADLVDATEPFAGFVAFHSSVVLVEGATASLPIGSALYENLALSDQGGDIAVRFAPTTAVKNLVYVDRFTIERERWVWRNLPIVPDTLPAGDAEKIRMLASGPPETVFGATRDTDAEVAKWERIASLDRGFVDRGEIGGRWPRVAPAGDSAGGPGIDVLLNLDNRDAVSSADYLRYGLRVRSRYAGVLETKESVAISASGSTRRRITTGFRGTKIKPPKILAVLPLTASLEDDPMKRAAGVSPFVVLLDETHFREYGVGERLEVKLALENLDIGEPEMSAVPYRTGPLPDHHLKREGVGDARYFEGVRVKPGQETIVLHAFGPFGYSLDITPSEALANASAFVIYAPEKVGAHWAMYARFRRVLDRPSAMQVSDWSDAHALYTLPDERRLFMKPNGPARPMLEIKGTQATLRELQLVLDPTAVPPSKDGKPLKNSEACSQYRYFVLVSRILAGAGQGFDAELPIALAPIPRFRDGYIPPGTFVVEHNHADALSVDDFIVADGASKPNGTGEYRGRILEILVNGQYTGPARLDTLKTWRPFWEGLLDGRDRNEIDAAGMIRRVSDSFVVKVE